MSPYSQQLRNLDNSDNEKQLKDDLKRELADARLQTEVHNVMTSGKLNFISCFESLKRSFENLTADVIDSEKTRLEGQRSNIAEKVNKIVIKVIDEVRPGTLDQKQADKIAVCSIYDTYKNDYSVLNSEFRSYFRGRWDDAKTVLGIPADWADDKYVYQHFFQNTSEGRRAASRLDSEMSSSRADAMNKINRINNIRNTLEFCLSGIARNPALSSMTGNGFVDFLTGGPTAIPTGAPFALVNAMNGLKASLASSSPEKVSDLAQALYLRVEHMADFSINEPSTKTSVSTNIERILKERQAEEGRPQEVRDLISSEVQNLTDFSSEESKILPFTEQLLRKLCTEPNLLPGVNEDEQLNNLAKYLKIGSGERDKVLNKLKQEALAVFNRLHRNMDSIRPQFQKCLDLIAKEAALGTLTSVDLTTYLLDTSTTSILLGASPALMTQLTNLKNALDLDPAERSAQLARALNVRVQYTTPAPGTIDRVPTINNVNIKLQDLLVEKRLEIGRPQRVKDMILAKVRSLSVPPKSNEWDKILKDLLNDMYADPTLLPGAPDRAEQMKNLCKYLGKADEQAVKDFIKSEIENEFVDIEKCRQGLDKIISEIVDGKVTTTKDELRDSLLSASGTAPVGSLSHMRASFDTFKNTIGGTDTTKIRTNICRILSLPTSATDDQIADKLETKLTNTQQETGRMEEMTERIKKMVTINRPFKPVWSNVSDPFMDSVALSFIADIFLKNLLKDVSDINRITGTNYRFIPESVTDANGRLERIAKMLGLSSSKKEDVKAKLQEAFENTNKKLEKNEKKIVQLNENLNSRVAEIPFGGAAPASHSERGNILTKNQDEIYNQFLFLQDHEEAIKLLEELAKKEVPPFTGFAVPTTFNETEVKNCVTQLLQEKSDRIRKKAADLLKKKIDESMAKIHDPLDLPRVLRSLIETFEKSPELGTDGTMLNEKRMALNNLAILLPYMGMTLTMPVGVLSVDKLTPDQLETVIFDALNAYAAAGPLVNRLNTLTQATAVRNALFPALDAAATVLRALPNKPSVADIERESEKRLQALEAVPYTREQILTALYLDPKTSKRGDIIRDIANKLEALISEIRFERHPYRLISNAERADVIDHSDRSESIVTDLMRDYPITGITSRKSYMDVLYKAIVDPKSNPQLYLHFKEVSARYKQEGEIQMLYYIDFLRQLKKMGYSFNVVDVRAKGFRPNPLQEYVISKNTGGFEFYMRAYGRVSERLAEHVERLTALSTRDAQQEKELKLLNALEGKKSKLNAIMKEVCEGYLDEKSLSEDGKTLLGILRQYYSDASGSATDSALKARGASAMEQVLAQAYKCILAFDTVDVHRIVEKASHKKEVAKLNQTRKDYAKNRRTLNRFGFWRRTKAEDLEDSRESYLTESRKYILETIRYQYDDLHEGTEEQQKMRSTDMKNRILEMLNNERKELFNTEIAQHHTTRFERVRTWWRRNKGMRLAMSLGLTAGAIGVSFIPGVGPLAVGTLLGLKTAFVAGSTEMNVENAWESIRNRFGKTQKKSRKDIQGMDFATTQDLLAAQTTLAISEEHQRVSSARLKYNARTKLPITDKGFDKGERPSVASTYAFGANGLFAGLRNTIADYRETTSVELWAKYNDLMRGVIDEGIAANENIDQIMDRVFAKERDLMISIENRENEIRKNNMYKKITAITSAVLAGGLTLGLHYMNWGGKGPGPGPGPTPPGPVPPGPVPPGPSASFTIPDKVYPPNIGNADLAMNSGLKLDHTPGIWQSIAQKLGAHGTRVFDSDPAIINSLLTDNPGLSNNINAIVYTGDSINISNGTAQLIANKLGGTWTAAKVLSELNKPWDPKFL